jgi:hypothetical protein
MRGGWPPRAYLLWMSKFGELGMGPATITCVGCRTMWHEPADTADPSCEILSNRMSMLRRMFATNSPPMLNTVPRRQPSQLSVLENTDNLRRVYLIQLNER